MSFRFYFTGVDPAPAMGQRADDGAIMVGCARPKWDMPWRPRTSEDLARYLPPEASAERSEHMLSEEWTDWYFGYVYAEVLRGKSIDEWSGRIHELHRRFGFTGVGIDPGAGGGGGYVQTKLKESNQMINGIPRRCRPITTPDDIASGDGEFILSMFKRSDPSIEAIWPSLRGDDCLKEASLVVMQEALNHELLLWPGPYHERPPAGRPEPPSEEYWGNINLDAMRSQMSHIQVAVNDDGSWRLTRNNARQFVTVSGRDDIETAGRMCYVRFRCWLASGGLEDVGGGEAPCWMAARPG